MDSDKSGQGIIRAGDGMRLSEAKKNRQYIIRQINTDEAMRLRLRGLGLAPDTKLQLLFRKRCGTVIIWVRGTRLAVGSGLAKRISVEEEKRR